MTLKTIVLICLLVKTAWCEDPSMVEYMNDFSVHTFMAFDNESKEYTPFDPSILRQKKGKKYSKDKTYWWWMRWDERVMNPNDRNWDLMQYYLSYFKLDPSWQQMAKTCITYQNTYRNAFLLLRKYFEIRQLYHNVLEYDVGYVTHEIVYRYIIMLELYQWIEIRYLSDPEDWKSKMAPLPYMFYVYTLILEMSKAIIHLSNMFQVIEEKYSMPAKGVFDDYIDRHAMNKKLKGTTLVPMNSIEMAVAVVKQEKEKAIRKKKRLLKLKKKLMLQFGILTTIPTPKRTGHWNKIYGWSIEEGDELLTTPEAV